MQNQLYEKFSCKRLPNKYDFKASKFYTLLVDPFNIWCNFHADKKMAVYEKSPYDRIKFAYDKKLRHELILKRHDKITEIKPDAKTDSFKKTLKEMIDATSAIVYGALWDLNKGICGTAHLLEKAKNAKSVFGNYYYRVVLFKNALEVKEYYALQATLLTGILGSLQGFMPEYAVIVLRNKEVKIPYKKWEKSVSYQLERWNLIKEGKIIPEPGRPPNASTPPWRYYANDMVVKNKNLVLLAETGWDVRSKLKNAEINDITKVVRAGYKKIKEIVEDKTIAQNIYENALAYYHRKPVIKQKGLYPPRRKKINLYFDFESSDEMSPDGKAHIYLIGLWDKEKNKYVHFLAKGAEDEQKIFEQFATYVTDPENTSLYHWTEYEVKEIKKIADKYPAISSKIKNIIRTCIDLKSLIKRAFYLPAPGFSLKAVAPAFGFEWKQNDCNAMDAMAYYWHWLEKGDEKSIKKVLSYNEDDCLAMLEVDQYLEKTKPVKFRNYTKED